MPLLAIHLLGSPALQFSDLFVANDLACVFLRQTVMNQLCRLVEGNLDLLAGLHVLDSDNARVDLILAEEDNERDAELVGIADLVLELLLLAVQLGADARLAQSGRMRTSAGALFIWSFR